MFTHLVLSATGCVRLASRLATGSAYEFVTSVPSLVNNVGMFTHLVLSAAGCVNLASRLATCSAYEFVTSVRNND